MGMKEPRGAYYEKKILSAERHRLGKPYQKRYTKSHTSNFKQQLEMTDES